MMFYSVTKIKHVRTPFFMAVLREQQSWCSKQRQRAQPPLLYYLLCGLCRGLYHSCDEVDPFACVLCHAKKSMIFSLSYLVPLRSYHFTRDYSSRLPFLAVVSASSDGTVRAWTPHVHEEEEETEPTQEPTTLGTHADYVRCLTHWYVVTSHDVEHNSGRLVEIRAGLLPALSTVQSSYGILVPHLRMESH